MKTITTASEKAVEKMTGRFSTEMQYLLTTMKRNVGCDGATISEMKKWGITLDNNNQFKIIITPLLRGMCYIYSQYIILAETHDLRYVTILDFNGLVKAIVAQEE